MHSNASINIEFLAGTSIEEAIKEASSLAQRLNLAYCCFSFNDVKCSISQHSNVELAVKEFHAAIKSDFKYLIK